MRAAQAKPEKLRCAACGMDAACDCGAEYIPAAEYARIALARSPEKSNRALAAESGVDESTVRLARASSGAGNPAPEAVVIGIDGKKYLMNKTKKKAQANLPYQDQPAVQRFINAMLKLSWGQKLYVWEHVLPAYDPRGVED